MGLSGLLSLQCISIAVSSVIVLVASKYPEILGITRAPIFPILLGLAMVEKLAAITSEVAIERDWVTQLCGMPYSFNPKSLHRKKRLGGLSSV